jgi:hexosaminidase
MFLSVALSRAAVLLAAGLVSADTLAGLPTVPFTPSGDAAKLQVGALKKIIVDVAFASTRDLQGQTLIPPTLLEFSNMFAEDLSILNYTLVVQQGASPEPDSIFLTLGNSSGFRDAAGRVSSEGYSIRLDSSGIVVAGASPLGTWWGTRTILQQIALGNGSLHLGDASDTPGWSTRGLMVRRPCLHAPPTTDASRAELTGRHMTA